MISPLNNVTPRRLTPGIIIVGCAYMALFLLADRLADKVLHGLNGAVALIALFLCGDFSLTSKPRQLAIGVDNLSQVATLHRNDGIVIDAVTSRDFHPRVVVLFAVTGDSIRQVIRNVADFRRNVLKSLSEFSEDGVEISHSLLRFGWYYQGDTRLRSVLHTTMDVQCRKAPLVNDTAVGVYMVLDFQRAVSLIFKEVRDDAGIVLYQLDSIIVGTISRSLFVGD